MLALHVTMNFTLSSELLVFFFQNGPEFSFLAQGCVNCGNELTGGPKPYLVGLNKFGKDGMVFANMHSYLHLNLILPW